MVEFKSMEIFLMKLYEFVMKLYKFVMKFINLLLFNKPIINMNARHFR